MNNPNPGWQQQPQPGPPFAGHQPPPGQAYGQPPGQPYAQPGQPYAGQPGQSQPGQPYPGQPYPGQPYGVPRRQGPGLAILAGLAFLPAVLYTYISAIMSWDGSPDSLHVMASVLGLAFSEDITGNVDFAITVSMIVASLVLLLAIAQAVRAPVVRWVLATLGGLVVAYYVYAVIWMLSRGGSSFVALLLVALFLWLIPTFIAVLPPVGRATRRAPATPLPQAPQPPMPGQWG
ncbi:hypothetical protein ACQPZF_37170 [Actinosynnema sp. CS-041913]|uniref:hypothetical protein n=1 Tax=Actinosynnema sp. CS-041913 TaxID=3239917 RepID=UPI003D8A9459